MENQRKPSEAGGEDMSKDLVERLRAPNQGYDWVDLHREAADEIESLRKQLAAFYRLTTLEMNKAIDCRKNVAQGQE